MRSKKSKSKRTTWTDRVGGDALNRTAPSVLTTSTAPSPYGGSSAAAASTATPKRRKRPQAASDSAAPVKGKPSASPAPSPPPVREQRKQRGGGASRKIKTATTRDIDTFAERADGDFARGIGPPGARTTAARARLAARDRVEAASVDAAFGALGADAGAVASARVEAEADASFQALLGVGGDGVSMAQVADEDAFLSLLSPRAAAAAAAAASKTITGGTGGNAVDDAPLPPRETEEEALVGQSLGAAIERERAAALAAAQAASPQRARSHVGGLARYAKARNLSSSSNHREREDELDEDGNEIDSILDAIEDASELRDGILDEAAGLGSVIARADLALPATRDAWLDNVVRPVRSVVKSFAAETAKIEELRAVEALRVKRVATLYEEEREELNQQLEHMRSGASAEEAALLPTVELVPTTEAALLAQRLRASPSPDHAMLEESDVQSAGQRSGAEGESNGVGTNALTSSSSPAAESPTKRTQRRAASHALSVRADVDAQLAAATHARDAVAVRLEALEAETFRRQIAYEEENAEVSTRNDEIEQIEIPRLVAAAASARASAEKTVATLTAGWAQTNEQKNALIPTLEAAIERSSVETVTGTLDGKRLGAQLAKFEAINAAANAVKISHEAWLYAMHLARETSQLALDARLFAEAKSHVARTDVEADAANALKARQREAEALAKAHTMPPHAPPLPPDVLQSLPPPDGVGGISKDVVEAHAHALAENTAAMEAGRDALTSLSRTVGDMSYGRGEDRFAAARVDAVAEASLTKREKRARAAAAERTLSGATKDVLLQQRELAATLARLTDRKRHLGWTENAESEIATATRAHERDLAIVVKEIATVQAESDSLQARSVEKTTRLARQLRVAQMNELAEMEAVMAHEETLASARIELQTITADATEAKSAAAANERGLRDAKRRIRKWDERDVSDVAAFKKRARRRKRWEKRSALSVRVVEAREELEELQAVLPTHKMELAMQQQNSPQREQALAENSVAQRTAETEAKALRAQIAGFESKLKKSPGKSLKMALLSKTAKAAATAQTTFALRGAQSQLEEKEVEKERLILARIHMNTLSEGTVDALAAKIDANMARSRELETELAVLQSKEARAIKRRKPQERAKRKAARAAAAELLLSVGGEMGAVRPDTAVAVVKAEAKDAAAAGSDTDDSSFDDDDSDDDFSSSDGGSDGVGGGGGRASPTSDAFAQLISAPSKEDAFAALLSPRSAAEAESKQKGRGHRSSSRSPSRKHGVARDEEDVLLDDGDVVGKLILSIETGTVQLGVLEGEASDWSAKVVDQTEAHRAVSERLTELRLASVASSKALATARQQQQREQARLDEERGLHAQQKREATTRGNALQETCDILLADLNRADRRAVDDAAAVDTERDEIMARIAELAQAQRVARDEAAAADALEAEAQEAVDRVAAQLTALQATEPVLEAEWAGKEAAATAAHERRMAAVQAEQRDLDLAISDLRNGKDDVRMETEQLVGEIEGPLKEEVERRSDRHAELRQLVRDQAAALVKEDAMHVQLREALRVALKGQSETEELQVELDALQAKILSQIGVNTKLQRDVDAVPKLRDQVSLQQTGNSEIKLQLNLILRAIERMDEQRGDVEAANVLIVAEGQGVLDDITDLRKRIEREGDRVQHVAERLLGEISRMEVRVDAAKERLRKSAKAVRRWERKMVNVTGDANLAKESASSTIDEARGRKHNLTEATDEEIAATKARRKAERDRWRKEKAGIETTVKDLTNKLGIMRDKLPKVQAHVNHSHDLLVETFAAEKAQIRVLKDSEHDARRLRHDLDALRGAVEETRQSMVHAGEKHARQVRRWHVEEERLTRELGIAESIIAASLQTTGWAATNRTQKLATLQQETDELDAALLARKADLVRVEAEAQKAKVRYEDTCKVSACACGTGEGVSLSFVLFFQNPPHLSHRFFFSLLRSSLT